MSLYFYFGLGLFLLAQAYWIFTKLRQTETKETKERLKTGLSMGDFQWERIKQMCLVYFLSCVFTIYICNRFDGNFCPVFLVVLLTYLILVFCFQKLLRPTVRKNKLFCFKIRIGNFFDITKGPYSFCNKMLL